MNILKLAEIGIKFIPGLKDFDNPKKNGVKSFIGSMSKFQISIMIIGVIIYAILNPEIVKMIIVKFMG